MYIHIRINIYIYIYHIYVYIYIYNIGCKHHITPECKVSQSTRRLHCTQVQRRPDGTHDAGSIPTRSKQVRKRGTAACKSCKASKGSKQAKPVSKQSRSEASKASKFQTRKQAGGNGEGRRQGEALHTVVYVQYVLCIYKYIIYIYIYTTIRARQPCCVWHIQKRTVIKDKDILSK